ncbi:outer membrane transport energization protein TonB [Chitinophaga sp. YR573]|nr:outer membrane transport energization protein TonB [Chitinophaga sp. YR573]
MLLSIYFIKIFICSGVLYAYYTLALRDNHFHQWNRYYLLLVPLLSLVLPLLKIPVSLYPSVDTPAPLITMQEFIINNKPVADFFVTPGLLIGILYGLVATGLLLRIAYNCRRVYLLLKKSRVNKLAGYQLVENQEIKSPFSFFRNIFLHDDFNTDSKEGQQILRHELAHINGHHTTDKLLMEVLCAMCWVNPFFHLFKRELSMVHEFIADKAAAEKDAADYAETILYMTLDSKLLVTVNNFTHKPVKRRINMLFNTHKNYSLMKKMIVFPVLTALVVFISCLQKNDSVAQTTDKKDTTVYTFVEKPPTFPGGEKALMEYLSKQIHYPKEAVKENVNATVFVNFVVAADGSIQRVKTVGPTKGYGFEDESIRVVKAMPNWIPGTQEGKLVAVEFNLPIRYQVTK